MYLYHHVSKSIIDVDHTFYGRLNIKLNISLITDEEIDKESLLCLDDQEIAKLIPKVGPRSKFKKKLKSLRVIKISH